MRRGRRWLLAVPVAAALAAAAAAATWFPREAGSAAVPTLKVERRPFALQVPAEGVLRAVRATPVTVPVGAPKPAHLAWLAPDGSRVRAGEVVVRFDPTELEKGRDEASARVEVSRLKLERHESESAAALRNLERDAEIARLEEEVSRRFASRDEELYSRREILDSQLDSSLAVRRRRHAEETRRSQEELAGVEADLLALEQGRAARDLERAESGLEALEVRSPHDGILVLARDWRGDPPRVGETVWPGHALAEIPDLSEIEAEIFVLDADAGALATGKPARVTVEAHPERVYAAEIRRIGSLARPRFRGSPVQYFAVTLALAETDPERMRPGQRVRAELLLEDLEDALVVPRQAVFERDGRPVVYRRRGDGFEAAAVTLGTATPGEVVVTAGLQAGDVVALADPTAADAVTGAEEGAETSDGPPALPVPGNRP